MAVDLNPYFVDADVVICGDNDEPGRKHVQQVAAELQPIAKRVHVLDLTKIWPQCPVKGDIREWIEKTKATAERLYQIIEQLPECQPQAKPEPPELDFGKDERLLAEMNRDNCVVPDGGKTWVLRFSEVERRVPAGAYERRWVVFRVAETKQNLEYFGQINAQLKDGGYAAMLYDLLHRDLTGWHPRQILRTAELARQQEQSLEPLDEWWFELLQTGMLGELIPTSRKP
jgi:hypothetical protein